MSDKSSGVPKQKAQRRRARSLTPDDVAGQNAGKVSLTVRLLSPLTETDLPSVLIEGDSMSGKRPLFDTLRIGSVCSLFAMREA